MLVGLLAGETEGTMEAIAAG
ncbi:MAG: hypothetical protein PWR29_1233, partial [Methanolobus sp.]|nr:hypothetical protein [Methanolobus sp.]